MTAAAKTRVLYVLSGAAFALAAILSSCSFSAWRLYRAVRTAAAQYDSSRYAEARETFSTIPVRTRTAWPELLVFEAQVLGLQGSHYEAVRLLRRADRPQSPVIKLALASEELFSAGGAGGGAGSPQEALLEEVVESCPDALVALGGARLNAGNLAGAGAALEMASGRAQELSFDGLTALWINLGVLRLAQEKHEEALRMFKKVHDILPERKLPALSGDRSAARLSAQRGLALVCVRWLSASVREGAADALEYVAALLRERQFPADANGPRWDLGEYRFVLLNALAAAQARAGLYHEADSSLAGALREVRVLPQERRESARHVAAMNRALTAAAQLRAVVPAPAGLKVKAGKAADALAEAARWEDVPVHLRYCACNVGARCCLLAGDRGKARELLARAAALMPREPVAVVNLAVLHDEQGDVPEALRRYEEALGMGEFARRAEVKDRAAKLKE